MSPRDVWIVALVAVLWLYGFVESFRSAESFREKALERTWEVVFFLHSCIRRLLATHITLLPRHVNPSIHNRSFSVF